MIYGIYKFLKNGKIGKKPVIIFDADNREQAYRAFLSSKKFTTFSENSAFVAKTLNRPTGRVRSASEVIAEYEDQHWKDDYCPHCHRHYYD